MNTVRSLLLACTCLYAAPALAEEAPGSGDIIVTGEVSAGSAATKTDTPAIEVPQPVTVITDEMFEAQGALSVSDTLNYVAGVQANPYGPDSRVDGGFIRGITPLQFRDGMRDVYSYYASIRADPYNFSQVEVVRGPASVLFGAGSLGGIINLASKLPEFTPGGEVAVRYGSFDRKELLADITGPVTGTLAARLVTRLRDADTQTDYVEDDRAMIAPSLTWAPSMDTKLTLLGLYQEDDSGSTSQFLPLVGTLLPNPNGKLPNDLFVGKPGWDRYDGRLLQGTALFEQRVTDKLRLNLKARYIDSDLTYFTHYPDSYSNPTNPYLDPDQRVLGLISSGSLARMEIFTMDHNLQFSFNTGAAVEHTLLAGVDYSWSRVRKEDGYGFEAIDIYDIDYSALSNYGMGLPQPSQPSDDTRQEQLGLYVQDQIRFFDRVSLVLGLRHDDANSSTFGTEAYDLSATTYRAGIIAEVVKGVSPFFSYTESFEPISGRTSAGSPLKPKTGRQFEAGIKLHPGRATLATLTFYHIKENGRAIDDPSFPAGDFKIQVDGVTSKGVEFEASTTLPGDLQILANVSYNEAEIDGTNQQLDNVPKFNTSLWAMKGFALGGDTYLRIGGGVRHSGENTSYGPAFANGIVTPEYTLVDAMAEITWKENWKLAVNATNLLGKEYYSACLARGDCFMGAERNVFATLSYGF
ncbi:ferrisiderophore receptor [Altererythrobacter sp. B11]|uniref:TonB-dependent siderophore receptor n=1 Tax=Altererythrobacter sp. B11 TaxID=2060312 RepID=UPI000DC6E97C|nr:TonB-dependent siderophore receptor [Altererythrobacter sp. B11]BBC70878.1 ferrisiderophore receptor [Altererythrobacter sp. B11]